jgi:hypothetical protein
VRRLSIALLLVVFSTSCIRYVGRRQRPKPTGTCPGACSHYVQCKGTRDHRTYDSCVQECREIYDDSPQALASYERLACEDAVAFIEGDSGRGPGR